MTRPLISSAAARVYSDVLESGGGHGLSVGCGNRGPVAHCVVTPADLESRLRSRAAHATTRYNIALVVQFSYVAPTSVFQEFACSLGFA
jgi:hypothetical protein